jgi:hypothetical protein
MTDTLFNAGYPHQPPRPEYPEIEVCGKCGSNTNFEWDELEGWVSPCCTARPMNVEPPSWMED